MEEGFGEGSAGSTEVFAVVGAEYRVLQGLLCVRFWGFWNRERKTRNGTYDVDEYFHVFEVLPVDH